MFSTPLSGSFTCHTCGKLGWEQPNCSPTANVYRNSCPWLLIDRVKWLSACVMCWPHRVGVSVCHLAFHVIIKEPRFNLMYDKFRFYQRQKFRLDLSLAKWKHFFLLWAGFFFLFFRGQPFYFWGGGGGDLVFA